jgi:hypothetical protein
MDLARSLVELLTGILFEKWIGLVFNTSTKKETVAAAEPVTIAFERIHRSRISRNQQEYSQQFLYLIHESLALEETRFDKFGLEAERH